LKTQLVVDKKTGQIISLAHAQGRCHDFHLFKISKTRFHPKIKALVDTGYLGLQKQHAHTDMPKKKSKNNTLSKSDKRQNRETSGQRVLCENVIGVLKRFRILSERYRNRGKRLGLRFFLIAAFYNTTLAL